MLVCHGSVLPKLRLQKQQTVHSIPAGVFETLKRAKLFVLCYPYLPMCHMLLDAAAGEQQPSAEQIIAGVASHPMEAEWAVFLKYLEPLAKDDSFFHEYIPLCKQRTH